MSTALPPLVLKRREDRRLRSGHPWVFSNEVDTARTPLTQYTPGDWVNLSTRGGRLLGTAYVNPNTLIAARLVSRQPDRPLDRAVLRQRLEQALLLRDRLYDRPCYRLVYGESDALPGLVVDRHGQILVVQIGTRGMERLRDDIVAVLDERLAPRALVLRNDLPARATEGLEQYVDTAIGEAPGPVRIEENGAVFDIDPLGGQKTGWFYDQRENRARLARYVGDARVLDLFSYAGGFGIQAALAGATEVICVDSSEIACELVNRNAALNDCAARVSARPGDAFESLKSLHADGEHFDVVVLDPPAFARRRKDVKGAVEAYTRLNRHAMQVLRSGGILASASCSSHLDARQFQDALRAAARTAGCDMQILERGHQAPDHPVHPALPESDYLKFVIARVTKGE